MAVNQIPLSPSNVQANAVLAYRNQLIALRQQMVIVQRAGAVELAKLASMVNGSDYTALESQLGLQAGQGVTLFDQTNSTVGNFADGTQTANAQNAAIDQYIGWVG